MKTERELFEDAMQELSGGQTKNDVNPVTGEYQYGVMEVMWKVWQASASREGYKLVPVEPTERMLDAARCRQWDDLSLPLEDMDMLKYKAMIGVVD